jgi:hypothetical protein
VETLPAAAPLPGNRPGKLLPIHYTLEHLQQRLWRPPAVVAVAAAAVVVVVAAVAGSLDGEERLVPRPRPQTSKPVPSWRFSRPWRLLAEWCSPLPPPLLVTASEKLPLTKPLMLLLPMMLAPTLTARFFLLLP